MYYIIFPLFFFCGKTEALWFFVNNGYKDCDNIHENQRLHPVNQYHKDREDWANFDQENFIRGYLAEN